MKILFAATLLMSLVLAGVFRTVNVEHENIAKDGEYVGLEKMPNLSPDDRSAAWFHENTLLIRNDEAILQKVPVTFASVEHRTAGNF